MSALLKRACCCLTNPTGWYTCKPVYCADAFVNEGFPALQEDAEFMTFLSEGRIQTLIDQGFFPLPEGDPVYWHDGVQLWVLDGDSDFLGDASSPQFLDPPIFAPPEPNGRFIVDSPPETPFRQPPPPLFSFTEELEINDERFLRVTHLGTALYSAVGTDPNIFNTFPVNMDPRPGPSPGAGPTNYNYQTYYRPSFGMANDLPTVKSAGLPIDMARIIYKESEEVQQQLDCVGERESGECAAQVVLVQAGEDFLMNYGPSTVEGVYGTNSIYIHPRHRLNLVMVLNELVSLEEQCDGTFNAIGPPYFFVFGQNEVPDDQGVFTGLVYQDGGVFMPCDDPIFPPVDPCQLSGSLGFGTLGFGGRARLDNVLPANVRMEITDALCSMFTKFPSSDSYVKTQGAREFPNPIDGLGVFFKGAGRSELASDFRVPSRGIDEGEENFIGSGNGLTIFQPVEIR